MKTQFKQTRSLNQAGGFFNHLMGNNASTPTIGEGATILLHSDRHAYTVISVSADKTKCKIRECDAKPLFTGMTDSQSYEYSENETNQVIELQWRNNAWRKVVSKIVFVDRDNISDDVARSAFGDNGDLKLIEGLTKIKMEYPKISILFGERRKYYDYSF